MGCFDLCLYFSGNQFARHMNNIAQDAFKDMDITPTQGFTLILISEKNMHTPTEIAQELGMDPSTITRFLDKLYKLGYIKREYYGRKTEVRITQSGVDKINNIYECWREIHDVYSKVLGEQTTEILTKEISKANIILNDRKNGEK